MDLELPPFKQRFPWWGGDLQTIATALLAAERPSSSKELRFPLDAKNTLVAMLDLPPKPETGKPLVLLIHGVPGSQDSPYMLRTSSRFLELGHHVLRLNLHGAGPSRLLCAGQYYAGSSDDIRLLLPQLPAELTQYGIVAVGYSIGGAILLKYLGEQGSDTPIRAAASVSAPVDLLGTCVTLMRFRNSLYHSYVLTRVKREALGDGAVLAPVERANIEISQTIWQYDDLFTAPRNGFAGAAEYYARCSALNFLPGIRIPTLVLASLDDPWVPGSAYSGHYWGSNKARSLVPILSSRGGHVGFHGRGCDRPWSDLALAKFFGG